MALVEPAYQPLRQGFAWQRSALQLGRCGGGTQRVPGPLQTSPIVGFGGGFAVPKPHYWDSLLAPSPLIEHDLPVAPFLSARGSCRLHIASGSAAGRCARTHAKPIRSLIGYDAHARANRGPDICRDGKIAAGALFDLIEGRACNRAPAEREQ